MTKKKFIRNRKSSAWLAAGAGAAVCLTGGGGVLAATGLVASSNGGNNTFGAPSGPYSVVSQSINLIGSRVALTLRAISYNSFAAYFGVVYLQAGAGIVASGPLYVAVHFPTGVTVSNGVGLFHGVAYLRPSQSNNYIALKFDDTGTRFGWVHVVSTNAIGSQLIMDTWGYNTFGGNIKTLSESVTTSRLALTDGKEKLHWTNENEDGVARYEVQSKDASGEWVAADSDVPGEGSYSAKVAAGATSRLVVEMTDGTTKEIDF